MGNPQFPESLCVNFSITHRSIAMKWICRRITERQCSLHSDLRLTSPQISAHAASQTHVKLTLFHYFGSETKQWLFEPKTNQLFSHVTNPSRSCVSSQSVNEEAIAATGRVSDRYHGDASFVWLYFYLLHLSLLSHSVCLFHWGHLTCLSLFMFPSFCLF